MERVTFEELKDIFFNWTPSPDENTALHVNAEEYIPFNIAPDGYLGLNDEEYLDAFRVYAECNYIEVWDIEEAPEEGWGIIISEPYPFAMPIDGEIEYEFATW